jgi:putative oxidoreductase
MSLGRLVLRTTVGGLLVGHGLQKLNGSFGGAGLEGTAKAMDSLGLHPARHQALAAGLSETIGGGLIAAGFLNPLGPAMITGVMAVAIERVHAKNGLWISSGGYEYNLTLIATAFLLAAEGPGAVSLDRLIGRNRAGFGWAVVALLLGLAGAEATVAIGEALAPPSDPDDVAPS